MKAVLYEKGGRTNASVTDVPVPEIGDEEFFLRYLIKM